jgi:peptidoglycan/LPS O-acetylase OafA/YrhL
MLALIVYRYSSTITGVAERIRYRQCLYGAAILGLAITRLEREFGFAIFFAALLLIITTETSASRPHRLVRFLEWRPVWWLGVISYSFYLWHLPVIWGVYKWLLHEQHPDTIPSIALSYILVLTITAGLSSATYMLIERPALLLKAKPNGKRAQTTLALPLPRDAH